MGLDGHPLCIVFCVDKKLHFYFSLQFPSLPNPKDFLVDLKFFPNGAADKGQRALESGSFVAFDIQLRRLVSAWLSVSMIHAVASC